MKYFLTGATGFLGGALARILIERGHSVTALVRSPEKASQLKKIGVTLIPGDITDKESMRAAMTGCDGVFPRCGVVQGGCTGPLNRLEDQCGRDTQRSGIDEGIEYQKGVYTSTLAVNSDTHGTFPDETFHFTGTHISEYNRTKAAAHDVAAEFMKNGLPLVVLMPGLIYGPDGTSMSDDALRSFLKGHLPVIPKKSAYSWAHVDDVAEAHMLAMEKGTAGECYIVSGEYSTLTDAFALAHTLTGKRRPISIPPSWLKLTSRAGAVIETLIPLPEMYSSEAMRVQAGVTYLGNNSKAKRELGYSPRPLKEGLKQTLEYELAKMKGR